MSRLLFLALLAACSGGDDTEPPVDTDPPDDTDTDTDSDTDSDAVCDGTALCERSIQECEVELTQAECETFYEPTSSCTDIDSYTECNCDCIEEPTCDGYFACGQVCFTLHC